jgi:hypothetical protein
MKAYCRRSSIDLSVINWQSHVKARLVWLRIENDRSEMRLDNWLDGIKL